MEIQRQKVLLLGATGETGREILEGLLADANYEVACLVQPSSKDKPAVKALEQRGLTIVECDLADTPEVIAQKVSGYDTIISAISAVSQTTQLTLVEAAAIAGTKRFIPCAFATIIPPGGITKFRDDKELVYQRIWQKKVPYTIIDIGYWHQMGWPRVPSGQMDYASLTGEQKINNEVFGDGTVKSLLSDKRDIGHFVARIIKDERTVNKWVVAWSDELSQNDVIKSIEEKSGEAIESTRISFEDLQVRLERARKAAIEDPNNIMLSYTRSKDENNMSKYIRGDNMLENAKYLQYLDARELYPDFKPRTFAEYIDEVLEGKA